MRVIWLFIFVAGQAISGLIGAAADEKSGATDPDLALVEKWRGAAEAGELMLEDRKYETETIRLTAKLASIDRRQAATFFCHACDLLEAAALAKGWEGANAGNGWLTRSNLLGEVMKQAPRLDTLSLILRLYQEDTTGNLTFTGWWQTTKLGQPLMEEWLKSGGTASTVAGCEGMLTALAGISEETPSPLLGVAFYDFCNRLNPAWRKELLVWLERPTSAAAGPGPLVEELRAGALLFCLTDSAMRLDPEVGSLVAALGGWKSVWRHYRGVMESPDSNSRVRLALGHHLCYVAGTQTDPEVVRRSAICALEAQRIRGCVHGYQFAYIMRRFAELPIDDVWIAAARNHYEAWTARCEFTPRTKAPGLAYSPCDWALHNMLRLSARAGQRDWLDAIFEGNTYTLTNEPSALVELVVGGQTDLAVTFMQEHWPKILHPAETRFVWAEEIAAGLPAFKAACKDEGLAYLAELMLVGLPDPKPAGQAEMPGFKPHDARILELAQRFPAIRFTDEALKDRCLQELAKTIPTVRILDSVYREYANRSVLTDWAANTEYYEVQTEVRPFSVGLGWKVCQGGVGEAVKVYEEAVQAPQEQDYYKRYFLRSLTEGLFDCLEWRWISQKALQPGMDTLLPLLDVIVSQTPVSQTDRQLGDVVALRLIHHHANQDAKGAEAWRKQLPSAVAKACENKLSGALLWKWVQAWSGGKQNRRADPTRRMDLLLSLLREPWVLSKYGPGKPPPNLVSEAISKSGLFTPGEFLPEAGRLCDGCPRGGRTAMECAEYAAAHGFFPESAAFYRLAAEAATKDPTLRNLRRLRQAEMLERTGAKAEAHALYTTLASESTLSAAVRNSVSLGLSRVGP